MKKRLYQLYIDPHQFTLLEEIARERGAPVAELVRRAIQHYLAGISVHFNGQEEGVAHGTNQQRQVTESDRSAGK